MPGACVAMSMQREFVCCHRIATKQLGLIMIALLLHVAVVPFQLMSILHAGCIQGCKQAVSSHCLQNYSQWQYSIMTCLKLGNIREI